MFSHVPCTNCAANFFLTLCLPSSFPSWVLKSREPRAPPDATFPLRTQSGLRAGQHSPLRSRTYLKGDPTRREHTKQVDQRSQGGILFVAFRGKVRNLQKLHRVNPPPSRVSSHRNWSKLAELPCRDKSMGL